MGEEREREEGKSKRVVSSLVCFTVWEAYGTVGVEPVEGMFVRSRQEGISMVTCVPPS